MAQVTRIRVRWRLRLAALICLILAAGLFPRVASSQTDPAPGAPLEYRLKAVFLLDFTKFIDWPPGTLGAPDSPFSICVLGNNPFGNELDRVVNGEVVYGRKAAVRKIASPQAPGSCQIVFVGLQDETSELLAQLGRGVLTVGEGGEFIRGGGMISFVVENHRVRFDINQAAAERAGFKLSSKLLSVAKSVLR